MAPKQKALSTSTLRKKIKKKRKGIHAKKGTSKMKNSKLYKKRTVGQG